MPDLGTIDVSDFSDEQKETLAAAMHSALHYALKIHHQPPQPPFTLVGLSLQYNSPPETRKILAQFQVSRKQIKSFMAVYQADYAIFRSDILQPDFTPPRLYDLDGVAPKD